MYTPLFSIFMLFITLVSCTSHIEDTLMNPPSDGLKKDQKGDLSQPASKTNDKDDIPHLSENIQNKETPVIHFVTNKELLLGKWQHIDDKTNYIVFEDEYRKEIAGSASTWNQTNYILSDRCIDEMDTNNILSQEDGRFISCRDSYMCWYIVDISFEQLELSYMGRGNSLKYNRVSN
ncbi:MAG: hypothetical protein MK066_14745 [Crocinitomicaceae bacterium]|nr:hypothetical protein [Crocinitomicaceae bacterium]